MNSCGRVSNVCSAKMGHRKAPATLARPGVWPDLRRRSDVAKRTIEERFWDKVDASGDCWEWTGATNDKGYGSFKVPEQGSRPAHRIAWTWLVGPISDGLDLDHLCRVRHCVNPDHLEPVTHRENLRRGYGTGANARKSHCKHGHLLDGANLYIRPNGNRDCKACRWGARQRHNRRMKQRA